MFFDASAFKNSSSPAKQAAGGELHRMTKFATLLVLHLEPRRKSGPARPRVWTYEAKDITTKAC